MFEIGSDAWPGISKLIEECGEVLQICGKLMGTGGKPIHFSGMELRKELALELGDLKAAINFVMHYSMNGDEMKVIIDRADEKLALFRKWHAEAICEKIDPTEPVLIPAGLGRCLNCGHHSMLHRVDMCHYHHGDPGEETPEGGNCKCPGWASPPNVLMVAIQSRIHEQDLTESIISSDFSHIVVAAEESVPPVTVPWGTDVQPNSLHPAYDAYMSHLHECNDCNFDKDCMACLMGTETGHCNCDLGTGGKLRTAADEERKRQHGS